MNTADFDQMITAIADHAKVLGEYMKKLEKEGFSRLEALQLCINFQSNLSSQGKK